MFLPIYNQTFLKSQILSYLHTYIKHKFILFTNRNCSNMYLQKETDSKQKMFYVAFHLCSVNL
jgi:hypothetical protein